MKKCHVWDFLLLLMFWSSYALSEESQRRAKEIQLDFIKTKATRRPI